MQQILKKMQTLHFKCTYFNSSMRVTVYAECIYMLTEYLKYLKHEGIVIFFHKMSVASQQCKKI